MDTLAITRQLVAAYPTARLPCPVCGASLNAANLDKHISKVHAGITVGNVAEWRGKGALGLFPVSLAITDGAITLKHMLGMGTRIVKLPCAIEAGATVTTRPDPIMAAHPDVHSPGTEERTGRYLRLVGERTITVACKQSTQFTAHWDRAGWKAGGKRSGSDIRVGVDAMVALEYTLAARGLLKPTITS